MTNCVLCTLCDYDVKGVVIDYCFENDPQRSHIKTVVGYMRMPLWCNIHDHITQDGHTCTNASVIYIAQWLRGRAADSRLREPGFEPCAAVFFTLRCSSSLNCICGYLTIDCGGYVYEQSSRTNCSIWQDASQR